MSCKNWLDVVSFSFTFLTGKHNCIIPDNFFPSAFESDDSKLERFYYREMDSWEFLWKSNSYLLFRVIRSILVFIRQKVLWNKLDLRMSFKSKTGFKSKKLRSENFVGEISER